MYSDPNDAVIVFLPATVLHPSMRAHMGGLMPAPTARTTTAPTTTAIARGRRGRITAHTLTKAMVLVNVNGFCETN